jgi:threonylcarbamoyladenosine tRNA methylthiotransferase MtaB
MPSFKIITLGCRCNQYESQLYWDQLKEAGFHENTQDPDYIIVNTCAVTHKASKESFKTITDVIKENPSARFFVTGCLTKEHEKTLKEIQKDFLIVVPNHEKKDLVKKITNNFSFQTIQGFSEHTRAFVKIQEGCNRFCTYCIIPYTRGRSRSRPIDEIVLEVNTLVDKGFKEIVLTGINIGDFQPSLEELIRLLLKIKELKRLRLSSIDPEDISEEMIDLILGNDQMGRSLHLSLQSASNSVLKRMGRDYLQEDYSTLVDKFRKKDPLFGFTTDVIVGFPQETEEEFNETKEFVEKVQFSKVHIFPFSPRKNTKAYYLPNPVPSVLIKERKKILNQVADMAAFSYRNRFIHKEDTVLLERGIIRNQYVHGHSSYMVQVLIKKEDFLCPNALVRVRIDKNSDHALIGSLLKEKL